MKLAAKPSWKRKRKRGKPCRFSRTDAGNAELFAALYAERLRYDHGRGRWVIWREHWWELDTTCKVYQLAKDAARSRLQKAGRTRNDEERRKEANWALESESRHRLEAAIGLARSEPPLPDPGTDWDGALYLLGVENGVLDLRTGTLRLGRPQDHVTMHAAVPFDPSAQCPRWEQFLREVFGGDDELTAWVQRAVGYSLTGDTSEQCFFSFEGTGANGKSTFLEALRQVLGDYAANTPFSTLEWKGRSGISNDVAALAGKRFITAVETNESVQLNEARIKQLTGSDPITARYLYREYFTFTMQGKIWLAFNHRPVVRDDSDAFWRRVRLIPLPRQFKGAEADKQLLYKLKEEAPGILVWAVQGCLAWQQDGLGEPPKAVQEATDAYREESDPLSEFIKERCRVHPDAQTTTAALWQAYTGWCNEYGCNPLDRKGFASRLKVRGFTQSKIGHARTRGWKGLSCDPARDADVRTDAGTSSCVSPSEGPYSEVVET